MNKNYRLKEFIAEGSFGKIYKGENIYTGDEVSIKIEPKNLDLKLLINESKVYHLLRNKKGIPSLKWFGNDINNYYLITDLLGISLSEILKHSEKLSEKIILEIGKQMLDCIVSFHEMKLIHRDIKPDNFLFGLKENKNQLYIIDYGFCKSYEKEGKHILNTPCKKIIGTPNYISLNIHHLQSGSRRDDLESWIYILMDLLQFNTWKKFDYERDPVLFYRFKKDCINENIPIYLKELLTYIRKLSFEENPDYDFIYNILKST